MTTNHYQEQYEQEDHYQYDDQGQVQGQGQGQGHGHEHRQGHGHEHQQEDQQTLYTRVSSYSLVHYVSGSLKHCYDYVKDSNHYVKVRR